MSKELFDSLSAEDQAMFQEAGLEASKWAYQHAKDTDAENREYLEGQMTVIDPDRELWKEFAAETNASYEANYTEDLSSVRTFFKHSIALYRRVE